MSSIMVDLEVSPEGGAWWKYLSILGETVQMRKRSSPSYRSNLWGRCLFK
jgi:hypothetical protein